MCGTHWRLLIITIIIVQVSNTPFVGGVNNGTSYYRTANTTRHYGIISSTNRKNNHTNNAAAEYVTVTQHDLVKNNDVEEIAPAEFHLTPGMRGYQRHLAENSIIFGLSQLANESQLHESCYQSLKMTEQGILQRDPWAMKVLDASGNKPAGFIFGNNYWLGSREACGAVQRPIGITLSKDYQRIMNHGLLEDMAPFDVDYRVLYLRHHSPWQVEIKLMSERIIHIGLCLPAACSAFEIQQLAQQYVQQRRFVEADLYDVHAEVLYMKDLKLQESFYQKHSFKLFGAFLGITCMLMLCACAMNVKPNAEAPEKKDALNTALKKDCAQELSLPEAEIIAKEKSSPEDKSFVAHATSSKVQEPENALQRLKSFVKCFDVAGNCEKMFATKEARPNEIPVINGLRSVSAVWIMLFHVLWYMYFTVDNKPFMISYAERVFFQYVSSAPLLVDVFFTISGFLQTYNFMRNTKLMATIRQNTFRQNVRQFSKMLFHRYVRLAPLYFVIMCSVDLLSSYIHDVSVFHIHDRFDQTCSQHWWRNVLFIQNLFDHQDMCVNWTWSLACEMQFFILATILLFVYTKYPNFVKCTVFAALAATIVWTFKTGLFAKFQLSFDVTFATGTEIYINPFVRILPYILGTMAAWYFMQRQGVFELSPLKEKCLWNLAILIFFSCIYSTYKRDISYMSSITLFVVGRLLFSLAVCWMIVGSATGRGSWWSRILEAKVFQHVNRLTYAIYLLNPFVIALIFSMSETSTHVDPFMLCVLASGFAVIVYLASIVFSLAFEMPYCNWSSLLLRRQKSKVA